jgi:hypothetical protein
MPDTPATRRASAQQPRLDAGAPLRFGPAPITAPIHSWFTSPARSHPNAAQAKELPLHLIQLILSHVRIATRRCDIHAPVLMTSSPQC